MQRIKLDFKLTLEDILPKIRGYFPNVILDQIAAWESSNALESMVIDGEKRYFNRAVENLMRIDKRCRAVKLALDGDERADRNEFIKCDIRRLLKSRRDNTLFEEPHNFEFLFTLSLDESCNIEKGEMLRLWLPAPRVDRATQFNVELIDSSSPCQLHLERAHASAYFEEQYDGESLNVAVKYSFSTYAQYCKEGESNGTENDSDTAKYLEQVAPHTLFSENIKRVANEIIGDERRPYYMGRLLFEAMRERYPWASAREYSTIENIPEYVIEHGHGDCGQIALLFITLCRYVAIPARLVSGFMLHTGYDNLHDWCEIFIEGMGWIPVDPSFGVQKWGENDEERYFYYGGMDGYRLVVNSDWGGEFEPKKSFIRSETVDFQRGEIESKKENIYFDRFKYRFNIKTT